MIDQWFDVDDSSLEVTIYDGYTNKMLSRKCHDKNLFYCSRLNFSVHSILLGTDKIANLSGRLQIEFKHGENYFKTSITM